jgi:hypothetical protein
MLSLDGLTSRRLVGGREYGDGGKFARHLLGTCVDGREEVWENHRRDLDDDLEAVDWVGMENGRRDCNSPPARHRIFFLSSSLSLSHFLLSH